jgi:uncharacterized protein (DUF2147 family)
MKVKIMMKSILKPILSLAGIFLFMITYSQTPSADAIIGKWLNEDKDAHIQVYKESGKYYGKIVWLNEPNEPATGLPKLDDENEDESLRLRPVMGLILLKDFEYDEDDQEWEDGTIYDPKNGSTYDCYMKLDENGVLKIRGYIGISWIGRNTYWTKVQ